MASPLSGSNTTSSSPTINGKQADSTVIKPGSLKDKLAKLNGQSGFPGNAAPRSLPQAPLTQSVKPITSMLPPPSDLPPQLVPVDDGFNVKYSDGKEEFQSIDGATTILMSTAAKKVEEDDAKVAQFMALAIEASTNAPKKISDKFKANMPSNVIDRSHEQSDAALVAEIAKVEAAGYEYSSEGEFWFNQTTGDLKTKDDLIQEAAQMPVKAPMPMPAPVMPSFQNPKLDAEIKKIEDSGYTYNAEGGFWCDLSGDIKTKDDLIQDTKQPSIVITKAPVKVNIDPMQIEVNKLLANGYVDLGGLYYNASLDQYKAPDDIQKDLIQEVNAAAKSEGYFFDLSAGKTGFEAIYRKNSGESMHFAEVYENFVNINFHI